MFRQKQGLVIRATRRIGFGLGFAAFAVAFFALGWTWFGSLFVAWASMILSYTVLRVMFSFRMHVQ